MTRCYIWHCQPLPLPPLLPTSASASLLLTNMTRCYIWRSQPLPLPASPSASTPATNFCLRDSISDIVLSAASANGFPLPVGLLLLASQFRFRFRHCFQFPTSASLLVTIMACCHTLIGAGSLFRFQLAHPLLPLLPTSASASLSVTIKTRGFIWCCQPLPLPASTSASASATYFCFRASVGDKCDPSLKSLYIWRCQPQCRSGESFPLFCFPISPFIFIADSLLSVLFFSFFLPIFYCRFFIANCLLAILFRLQSRPRHESATRIAE